MKKLLILSYCMFFFLSGYSKDMRIRGSIVDSLSLSPIAYATFQVFDSDNHNVFNAILVDSLGFFDFRNVHLENNGYITISHLGYEKKTINITAQQRELALGQIKMVPNNFTLSEVYVIADAKTMFMADKVVHLVDSAMLANVSVTAELLKKIPQVSVNELTRVARIQGLENTLVLVNGINTGSSVDLRTVNPNDILKVEVITIPSSGVEIAYDGVINIILREEPRKGVSGDTEVSFLLNGRHLDAYAGVIVGFEKVRINLAYRNYYRAYASEGTEIRTNTNTQDVYKTKTYAAKPWEVNNDVRLNIDYYINKKHYLNVSTKTDFLMQCNKNWDVQPSKTSNNITEDLTKFTQQLQYNYFVGNYTLFYKYKIKEDEHYLTANFNLNVMNTDENTTTLYESGETYGGKEQVEKLAGNLMIDYSNTLNNWLRVNAGFQCYNQNFDGILNNGLGDNKFHELRYSGFLDLYLTVMGLTCRLGIKAEENRTNFRVSGTETVVQQFLSPLLLLNKQINKYNTIRALYRKTSYYPSAWQLAPYSIQYDSLTIRQGNPLLQAQTQHSLSLRYNFSKPSINLSAALFYNYSGRLIRSQVTYDNNLFYTIMPKNLGQRETFGIALSGSSVILGFMEIEPEMSLYRDIYKIENIMRSNWFFTANLSLTVGLPWRMAMGTWGSFSTKRLTIQGHIEPQYELDAIFVMKKFQNLNVFLALRSVVKSNETSYIFSENLAHQSIFEHKTFGFAFRINYFFNTGKKYKMEKIDSLHEMDKK
ncbi:MAG: outer membrane beta-barrel protein [Bacteroidales bacterium]|nr:outer membrane beta-barrel protein [Bacteroidales bacterium]